VIAGDNHHFKATQANETDHRNQHAQHNRGIKEGIQS